MSNFSHVLFFTVIICFEAQLLVYCEETQLKDKYPWAVEEDEIQVENLVIEYAKKWKQKQSIISGVLQRALSITDYLFNARESQPSDTEIDSNTEIDISALSAADKMFMCTAILRLNYFGMQFVPSYDYEMNTSQQKISLKHLNPNELKTDTLTVFQCPELQYIDLETAEFTKLTIKYFISGTHLPYSFLLYLQEGPNLEIYPHKFASEVNLNDFDELRPTYDLSQLQESIDLGKMTFYYNIPGEEKQLKEFIGIRESQYVYERFGNFFGNLSVCGMRRTHIIALCRYIANSRELEIDHRGYDESNCHKREVFSKPSTSEDSTSVSLGHFHMVKCPARISEVNGNKNKFTLKTTFLTANQLPKSVFWFTRSNLQRQNNITLKTTITGLKLHMLNKDKNRIREFLKPQYIPERKPKFSDLTTKLIRTSGLRIFPQGPPSITFNRNVVEDNTIIFSNIKEIKSPYERFEASYTSININMWPARDIAYLCHIILQDKSYDLVFSSDFNFPPNFENRSQIEVKLAMRDATLLHNENITARQCPPGFITLSTYFIVGTIFRDTITVHVKYEKKLYAFPDAFVRNVNKAEIQAVTMKQNRFPYTSRVETD